MGGCAGAATDIVHEPSLRGRAIEKAQAELRREISVREERRRELEFLEKGGDILDFFSAAGFAFQTSSQTEPRTDQPSPSWKNAGRLLAPSINGGSLDHNRTTSFFFQSCTEVGNELGTGDDSLNVAMKSLGSCEGRSRALRTSSTSLRTSTEANLNQDPGGGPAGVKGQAYSRRNRQRTNRFKDEEGTRKESVKPVGAISPSDTTTAPCVASEGWEENETMVGESMQLLSLSTVSYARPLVSTKGHEGSDGSCLAKDSSNQQRITLFEHTPGDPDGPPSSSRCFVPESCGERNVTSHEFQTLVCSENGVKDDSGLAGPWENESETLLNTAVERSVGSPQDGVFLVPSAHMLDKNREAQDKASVLPRTLEEGKASNMVKDAIFAANCDCQKAALVQVSNDEGLSTRNSGSTDDGHDTTSMTFIDHKASVGCDGSSIIQVPSRSLETLPNNSFAVKKTNLTLISSALDSSQIEKTEQSSGANVVVKVEEGLSEGSRWLAGSQVERGQILRRSLVISPLEDEVKLESQFTLVSAGNNRSGLRMPNSNSVSCNKFPGVVLPWEKEKDPKVIAAAKRHKADLCAKAKKAHEEYVLEEAEIIKNTRSESAVWATKTPVAGPLRLQTHWDYLLQEMAWMANDFMQERLWKQTSAAQFCRWIALRINESEYQKTAMIDRQKRVAQVLAHAVCQFWMSVEASLAEDRCLANSSSEMQAQEENESQPMELDYDTVVERSDHQLDKTKVSPGKVFSLRGYACRILRKASVREKQTQAEAPSTPERVSESSSALDSLWEDQFPEEALFYIVQSGALLSYHEAVAAERASLENEHVRMLNKNIIACSEAEVQAESVVVGPNSEFCISSSGAGRHPLSFLSSQSEISKQEEDDVREQYEPYALSKTARKKRKNPLKSNFSRREGVSVAAPQRRPLINSAVDTTEGLSPLVTSKRSVSFDGGNLVGHVGSIPTKRMRSSTYARQRILGAVSRSTFTGSGGVLPGAAFSPGSLNSHLDDTLSGGEDVSAKSEADFGSVRMKVGIASGRSNSFFSSKLEKKIKQMNGASALLSKRDEVPCVDIPSTSFKLRESEQCSMFKQLNRKDDQAASESVEPDIGGLGSLAKTTETLISRSQQSTKKLKILKQTCDLNSEGVVATLSSAAVLGGPLVANNSTTSNKLLRQNSNRDRNRKTKFAKTPVNQLPGVGLPWSTNEDQAIFALVHDLGFNWELVSDVLSSSSLLRGLYRKPEQCKERYRSLVDRMTGGDGGDSLEDPSTLQPHPSSLPGVSKVPVEEESLKFRLENIAQVVRKCRSFKPPSEEPKLLVHPHSTHQNVVAQYCLNGSCPNPLELCEMATNTPEISGPSYSMQGLHLAGVLASGPGLRPTTSRLAEVPGTDNVKMGVGVVIPSSAPVSAARDIHRIAALRSFAADDASQRAHYQRAIAAAAARGLQVPASVVTAGLPVMGLIGPSDSSNPLLGPGNIVSRVSGLSRGMPSPVIKTPAASGNGPPPLGNVLPPSAVGSLNPTVAPANVSHQINVMRRMREQQLARINTQTGISVSNLGSKGTREVMNVQGQPFQQLQHQNHQQYYAASLAKERHQMHQKPRNFQQQLPQLTTLQSQMQTQGQQQQHLQAMSQQHVLPQQSHMSQQQHLMTAQHNLPKQQARQGTEQTSTFSPSLQPTASTFTNFVLPQQQPSLGQVPPPPVQSKLQPPKQAQKLTYPRQATHVIQHQPPRGSKVVVRGSMTVQTSGLISTNESAESQPQQLAEQQMALSVQGSRQLMVLAKPLSQTTAQGVGHTGLVQCQQQDSLPAPDLQQSSSTNVKPNHQQQSPTSRLTCQQRQHQVQQGRQLEPQRKLQQRQSSSNVGDTGTGQLCKNGISWQSRTPVQPTCSATFPQTANVVLSGNLIPSSSGAAVLPSCGSPNSSEVHSTPWRPGQSTSSVASRFYNVSRSGNPVPGQLPSVVIPPEGHSASSHGSSDMTVTRPVNDSVSELYQTNSNHVGQNSSHGSKLLMISGASSHEAKPGLQTVLNRSMQHQGNRPASTSKGCTQVRSLASSPAGMMIPVSSLGAAVVSEMMFTDVGGYQGQISSSPSNALLNSRHMFNQEPRLFPAALSTPVGPSETFTGVTPLSSASAANSSAVLSCPTLSTSTGDSAPL